MKPASLRPLAAALACAAAGAWASIDVAGLDRAIDPCTDLYQFANGRWIAANEIPADQSRWGTFQLIGLRNEALLTEALAQALAAPLPPEGSARRKLVQFYASGMDRAAIERAGLAPLEGHLAAARAVAGPADLARALASLHAQGFQAGFHFGVDTDAKQSTRYLPRLTQGGLGMPDRDYYFLDDARSKQLREAYRRHVARMFELAGDSAEDAARQADAVLALETELARDSFTRLERRDEEKNYNRMGLAGLEAAAPGFPWADYFRLLGAPGLEAANVGQPRYFAAFARLAAKRDAAEWRAYLRWHVLHDAAATLPERFEREDFDFYERQIRGTQAPPPRPRHVMRVIGGNYGEAGLGQAIGLLFVERAFPPEAKARALEMVANIRAALAERLAAADWMTEPTRARSLEKLAAMRVKIGYPEPWRDFSSAEVGPYSFAENWMRSREFDHRRRLARIGKSVDRTEWYMSPHIVNAYYSATANEIVFPAAILQPPFFDAAADDAANYGAIGAVIGHEITHGFDDRGRLYDKDGNLREWWTPEDNRRYKERAQRLARQFDGFPGVEGVKVNGALTLGENLSDLGGLKIAYHGLQKALAGKDAPRIDGLAPEQRFFIAYAQAWRGRARPEWERNQLLTGQHSLPRFRVRGPIAHMPEFARAFSCEPSKTLLGESERANIW